MTDPSPADRPVATARRRAHQAVRAEILAAAGRQLAEVGAAALSLRAVAREVGMVSSAVYRYFASRDELLTALIVAAYDELGEATERSVAATRADPPLERWVAAAVTIRRWAVANPHDYALLYGSPVPGYAAPADTVVPGTRVSRALMQVIHDAIADGRLERVIDPAVGDRHRAAVSSGPPRHEAFAVLRDELDLDAPDATLLAALVAWTQLFGLLSFELFGQTVGLVDDHDAFFRDAVTSTGRAIGLA